MLNVQADLHQEPIQLVYLDVAPHPRRVAHHLDQRAQAKRRIQDPVARARRLIQVYKQRSGEECEEGSVPGQGRDVAVDQKADGGHRACESSAVRCRCMQN